MIKELKETDFPYYCSDSNYTAPRELAEPFYDSWKSFNAVWEINGLDFDLNLLFRYDVHKRYDDEDNHVGYDLQLFFMKQRKGHFVPIYIENIKEEDLPEINEMLKKAKEKIKELWGDL